VPPLKRGYDLRIESSTTSPAVGASTPLEFGRLEPLKVREYWKDEAHDFTPWLAREENLGLLAETIGMNLELVGTEQRVGPFKADIVARDGDHIVVVENQLDSTDHGHLGQLLVYAAGHRAHTVVWIAKQVTDEYRKVIDWLNEETTTNFWALEIELWRIGASPPAPKFNVVCEPNELTKPALAEATELTETKLLQLEFWKAFSERLETSSFNARKPFPQHWYDLSIGTGRAHIALTALVANRRIGCELYIGHSQADAIFEQLHNTKNAIEAELGELEWQPLPEKKSSRIAVYRQAEIENQDQWPLFFEWLLERAEAFRTTFAPRVKQMVLPDSQTLAPVPPPALEEADAVPAASRIT
jgi:Domain of unknown function (DUF4268)